jgi:hypothetical protein
MERKETNYKKVEIINNLFSTYKYFQDYFLENELKEIYDYNTR